MINVLGVTGHRDLSHSEEEIKTELKKIFLQLNPTYVITGMAVGFDQIVAEVCREMKIKYIAALPFKEPEKIWAPKHKKRFWNLLRSATIIKYINDGGFEKWKYLKRDEWIADKSDQLVSYLDGRKSGGTFHTVQYFQSTKKSPIINIFDIISKKNC